MPTFKKYCEIDSIISGMQVDIYRSNLQMQVPPVPWKFLHSLKSKIMTMVTETYIC